MTPDRSKPEGGQMKRSVLEEDEPSWVARRA